MNHLLYALNATMPVFLLMMAGVVLRKTGLLSEGFVSGANCYVFKVALPVSLFVQLSGISFFEVWDTGFVFFCLGATLLSIFLACGIARLLVPQEDRGEFVQASYRSSASLLGMAFMENLYGEAAMGSLMILGSVPVYNIAAVLILSLMRPGGKLGKGELRRTVLQVLTNPIILGTLAGFVWSCLPVHMPQMIHKPLADIGKTATPVGLIAMGAQLQWSSVHAKLKEASLASLIKLVVFAVLFVPLAVACGFREDKLIAILVMLGSATTVAGFIMAKNMGHDGSLTQATVLITTLLSAFTLTVYIFLLRTWGLL